MNVWRSMGSDRGMVEDNWSERILEKKGKRKFSWEREEYLHEFKDSISKGDNPIKFARFLFPIEN